MARFSQILAVEATPEQLWSLVRDVRRVAELFPFTAIDEFTALDDDHWLFWRTLSIPNVADLRWREDNRAADDYTLHFAAVEGELEVFAGQWQVKTNADGAELTLALEYAIPEHLRPNIPGPMIEFVMGEIFRMICRRVKETAEEERG